jgi:heme A synthase
VHRKQMACMGRNDLLVGKCKQLCWHIERHKPVQVQFSDVVMAMIAAFALLVHYVVGAKSARSWLFDLTPKILDKGN